MIQRRQDASLSFESHQTIGVVTQGREKKLERNPAAPAKARIGKCLASDCSPFVFPSTTVWNVLFITSFSMKPAVPSHGASRHPLPSGEGFDERVGQHTIFS